MRSFLFFLAMILVTPLSAAEIEGVDVPDSVQVAGKTLSLNGAGVRTKFFFDIYVGALYLRDKASTSEKALSLPNPKRLSMTFLYGEVGRERLVDGWIAGFEKNQSSEEMEKLKSRLDSFNAMFADARKGDVYIFDFLEDGKTLVTFNGKKAGVIEGADFQRALLEVWLGEKPADKGLRAAMLQGR